MFWMVVGLIGVALLFDYINGFHDAANSIATVVSTRVLSPGKAVIWAAFFNFVAAFVFGTAVAKTIGSCLVPAWWMHGCTMPSSLKAAISGRALSRSRSSVSAPMCKKAR